MICYLDHIALNMINENAMLEFYTTILELSPDRLTDYKSGQVQFPSFRLNPETIIDLFPEKMWKRDENPFTGREKYNHLCLRLDKIEVKELQDRLEQAAVSIEQGPVTVWGARGTGTSIYFRDPDGNLIEAKYYDDQPHSDKEK